jgi:O-methyltransferase
MAVRRLMRAGLRRLGYDIVPYRQAEKAHQLPADLTEDEKEIYAAVKPFTMTSLERVVALIQATRYIVENNIAGDIVECGVWRGGSMMAVAHTLKRLGATDRKLYLYDTFSGMPPPTGHDRRHDGRPAQQLLNETAVNTGIWCYADRRDVDTNLRSTGYPEHNIILVEGAVEETIPRTLPDHICLLRLDTDWYESTKHELTHLYPRLVQHGVLIIDDYGHWQGARQATDEYFSRFPVRPLLQRVDYTGRITVKADPAAP